MVARWWLAPPLSSASAPDADEQNELENEDDVDEDDDDEQVERPFVFAELIRFCWSELTKSSAIEHSWCESEPPRSDELDHGFELPTM